MVTTGHPNRQEAALDWFVRTNDPDFEAWDDLTAWLEQDPANADAFHALADSEAELLPLVDQATRVPAPRPKQARRFAALASVAAAALVALVTAPQLMPVEYQTAPGELRTVALNGRDQLVLNGATKVRLTGWSRRNVRLESGQVLVRLLEPGASKIALTSGDLKLVDFGTIFEVARDGRETRVKVSEGAVVADPSGARLKLDAGEGLETVDGAARLQAVPASLESVGSFERGQLTYLGERLDHVVADLRRSTGLDISLDQAMRARRFTGTLSIAEVRRDPRSLGPLLGASLQSSGKGWKLQERA